MVVNNVEWLINDNDDPAGYTMQTWTEFMSSIFTQFFSQEYFTLENFIWNLEGESFTLYFAARFESLSNCDFNIIYLASIHVRPGRKRDHGFHAENHGFWGPITFF